MGAVALAVFLVVRRRKLEPTVADRRRAARRRDARLRERAGRAAQPREAGRGPRGTRSGRWTYLLVGVLAFLETGAFVGLLAPGETFMVFGGVVAGQGRIDLLTLIAIVWTAAILGDVTSFTARAPARARVHGQARPEGAHHRGAPQAGRGVLRATRRQGDPARPLRRPGARDRPVPRRRQRDAAAALPSLRRHRRGTLGQCVRARSATCSGRASTRSSTTPRRGRSALGATIVVVVGTVWRRAMAARRGQPPRGCKRGSTRQLDRPLLRPLARVLRPLWRDLAPPAALRLGARDARRARAWR